MSDDKNERSAARRELTLIIGEVAVAGVMPDKDDAPRQDPLPFRPEDLEEIVERTLAKRAHDGRLSAAAGPARAQ